MNTASMHHVHNSSEYGLRITLLIAHDGLVLNNSKEEVWELAEQLCVRKTLSGSHEETL